MSMKLCSISLFNKNLNITIRTIKTVPRPKTWIITIKVRKILYKQLQNTNRLSPGSSLLDHFPLEISRFWQALGNVYLLLHNSQYTDGVGVCGSSLPTWYKHERVSKFHEAHPLAHVQRKVQPLIVFFQHVVFWWFVVYQREATTVQMHLTSHARVTRHHYDWTTRPESRNDFSSPNRKRIEFKYWLEMTSTVELL